MSMVKKKQLPIIFFGVVCVLATAALFFACSLPGQGTQPSPDPVNPDPEEGATMTIEETIEANTKIILQHFKEIGYGLESYMSQEEIADGAATWLTHGSSSRIATINSEPYENGGIKLTIVDEEGKTVVLPLSKYGSIEVAYDGEGNILFAIIE